MSFDKCIHHERIPTIELINTSITSHIYIWGGGCKHNIWDTRGENLLPGRYWQLGYIVRIGWKEKTGEVPNSSSGRIIISTVHAN